MILAVKNSEDSLHMSVVSLLMSGTQKSGTPECAFKIGSDGGVPLPFKKMSKVGVSLFF
jgi:hypothetical protein